MSTRGQLIPDGSQTCAEQAAGGYPLVNDGAQPNTFDRIVQEAIQRRATDIHIGLRRVLFRIDRRVVPAEGEVLPSDLTARAKAERAEVEETLHRTGAFDYAYTVGETRARVSLRKAGGAVAASVRLLPVHPLPLTELHLPPHLARLATADRGLILITGGMGQGKTTTMMAMLQAVAAEAPRAIGIVEDPIELLLAPGKSQVEQREVGPGRDVPSYHEGARQAVRQGLDVFVLGELRDPATAEVALQMANGGTLVLTTFHAASAAEALERLVFFFRPESAGRVQRALAAALHALVTVQLVGSAVEGVRPKVEVLTVENQAGLRNLIRQGEFGKLYDYRAASTTWH